VCARGSESSRVELQRAEVLRYIDELELAERIWLAKLELQ